MNLKHCIVPKKQGCFIVLGLWQKGAGIDLRCFRWQQWDNLSAATLPTLFFPSLYVFSTLFPFSLISFLYTAPLLGTDPHTLKKCSLPLFFQCYKSLIVSQFPLRNSANSSEGNIATFKPWSYAELKYIVK